MRVAVRSFPDRGRRNVCHFVSGASDSDHCSGASGEPGPRPKARGSERSRVDAGGRPTRRSDSTWQCGGRGASGEPGPRPKARGSERSRVDAGGRPTRRSDSTWQCGGRGASGEPGPRPKARGSERSRVDAGGRPTACRPRRASGSDPACPDAGPVCSRRTPGSAPCPPRRLPSNRYSRRRRSRATGSL